MIVLGRLTMGNFFKRQDVQSHKRERERDLASCTDRLRNHKTCSWIFTPEASGQSTSPIVRV